jgi:phosphate transport system permease protein
MKSMEGNQAIIDAIRLDVLSIGYVGVGYLSDGSGASVRGIKVINISTDAESGYFSPLDKKNFQSYAISRPLFEYFATVPENESVLRNFLVFELSENGQKIVEESGAVIILISIFGFLFFTGIKAFIEISLKEFFFSTNWNPVAYGEPHWGILSLVVGTLIVTFGSLIMAVPIGIATAIYLSEIAGKRTREILKPLIELIASIPSVVLGLIGILFLSPLFARIFGLSNGLNGLTSSIIVGIMILPTIISLSEDVLTALPNEFREASLALGATRWQMIRMTLLPAALSGIAASIMLALGRAVGETMVVLMVAGNARAMPHSIFDSVRPMTANIAIEIKEVIVGGLHYDALFAVGVVLFVMTFAVNVISDLIIEKYVRKHRW